MDPSQISLGVAFLAGLVSFLSPCMLPLVPIYLVQLVGQSTSQDTSGYSALAARLVSFFHAALFVLGFTLAFVALGATASALGSLLRAYQFQLREISGVLLVLIGLSMLGVLKFPFLLWQKRFTYLPSRPGYPTSLLIGIIFAIGWTPCISLVLGSVLGMAAVAATLSQGVLLLLVYSLGMGAPFLLLGLGLNQAHRLLQWLKPHTRKVEIFTGIVMIGVGIAISLNWLVYLNRYAAPLFHF
jgi:cytochrome c-type biogenesis protein